LHFSCQFVRIARSNSIGFHGKRLSWLMGE